MTPEERLAASLRADAIAYQPGDGREGIRQYVAARRRARRARRIAVPLVAVVAVAAIALPRLMSGKRVAQRVTTGGSPTTTAVPGGVAGQSLPPPSKAPVPTTTVLPVRHILDVDLRDSANVWVAISQPCATGSCIALAHSSDGGVHWQPTTTTDVPVATALQCSCGATRVVFANASDGYLFGPGLYTTTDGGRTWRQQPDSLIDDLVVDGPDVIRLAYHSTGCPGPCAVQIQYTSPGTNTWTTVTPASTYSGFGGVLSASGSGAVYALFGDNIASGVLHQPTLLRSTDAGRSWTTLPDSCAGTPLSEAIGLTASADTVVLACEVHGGGPPAITVSSDRGATFSPLRPAPASLVALTASNIIVATEPPVAGPGGYDYAATISSDSGAHWTQTVTGRSPQVVSPPGERTLTSNNAGEVALIDDPSRLWLSTDEGKTWSSVSIDSL